MDKLRNIDPVYYDYIQRRLDEVADDPLWKLQVLKENQMKIKAGENNKSEILKGLIKYYNEQNIDLIQEITKSVPIDFIKEGFPEYYSMMEKEFESFFNSWMLISSNKAELKKQKTLVFEYFILSMFNQISRNPEFYRDYNEYKRNSENNDNNAQFNNRLLKSILLEPIENFFSIPNLIINSMGNQKDSFDKLFNMLENEKSIIESNYNGVNNELAVAHRKLKENKNKIVKKKKSYTVVPVNAVENVIPIIQREVINNAEQCRFKNGTINFSKLGKILGVTHHTAKSWCIRYGINLGLPR